MSENYQMLELNFEDLGKTNFFTDEPTIFRVMKDGVPFEFLVRLRETSERLLIMNNGAYNAEKNNPPIFQRHSWMNKIIGSVIIVSDPTLYLGKINLGWGQGTKERFYLKEIANILNRILSKVNYEPDKVQFYGSSAGGFMSMYLATLVEGSTAIVNNPQIDVSKYYKQHVEAMYKCSYPQMDRDEITQEYKVRLSLVELFKEYDYIPKIYYLQNLACKHDVSNHLLALLEGIKNRKDKNHILFNFYHNEQEGHLPKGKEDTLHVLNETPSQCSFIKLNSLETSQLIKITNVNRKSTDIGNQILRNNFFIKNGLDSIDFSEGINWDYEHGASGNTYQLYLQSLNVLSYLLNAFEQSSNLKYLLKAHEITESWIAYNDKDPDNSMLWYDHPTAYRAHNLVYFLVLSQKHIHLDTKKYAKLVEKHAEYLMSDDNYRKNNHGIMMDRALILLGIVMKHPNSANWIQKGIWRLKDTFYSSYSHQGVHLENSPEYHRIVETLYRSTEQFLKKNQLTLGKDLIDLLGLSNDYYKYITKPDGFMPLIGDSGKLAVKGTEKKFDSFHDQTAGITIMQEKFGKEDKQSTWLSFVSGYETITHKHFDDLSISLFYNGSDILVDSGKYSYGKSKIRGYVKSPNAHSILSLRNKRYKLDESKGQKTIATSSFMTNNRLDIVKGHNNAYPGVKLERTVLFFKPHIVVIVDEIDSDKQRDFSQLFNLAPNIEILEQSPRKVKLKSDKDLIEMEQYTPYDELLIHEGNLDEPRALIAEKFGKVIETKQLEFIKKCKKGHLLTVFKLGEDSINEFHSAKYKAGKLTIDLLNDTVSTFI
ncbi:Heparinase II/III N-terminus [Halobacillus dabanensis]|uniref:Heparinase II/III N-terminus n=1 Tax=Halobacillus dabanensis TaxID=240302 RepID=A0A1I3XG90_HALDA|nr:heparinase II/III family protein [Halobacillus dabanensis]SFK18369.1 Heparinase II/III N-terminus [Halobacillus dabanensis]